MTEIYLNHDLFYPDGYKLTVTDQSNKIVTDFVVHEDTKNYLSLELTDTDSFTAGETIKVNLTPTLVGGSASGSEDQNGYTLDWTVTDTGASADCSYDVTFASDNGEKVYVELVTGEGNDTRLQEGKAITDPCYWMSGGSVRVMKKRFPLSDQQVMEVPLPYLNGASVSLNVAKSASNMEEDSVVSSKFEYFSNLTRSLF